MKSEKKRIEEIEDHISLPNCDENIRDVISLIEGADEMKRSFGVQEGQSTSDKL